MAKHNNVKNNKFYTKCEHWPYWEVHHQQNRETTKIRSPVSGDGAAWDYPFHCHQCRYRVPETLNHIERSVSSDHTCTLQSHKEKIEI